MRLQLCTQLSEIPAAAWNRLTGSRNPFLQHAFLNGLEQHHCLHPYGWQPVHLLAYAGEQLHGALPLYLKTNSYGEFVFDWAWASAYERNGLDYYPKLVSALPYTPATGPRLLVAPQADAAAVRAQLNQAAWQLAQEHNCSSLHYLFTDPEDSAFLQQQGLMLRMGCQFHWQNNGYRDFTDYLDAFTSKKRKQIKRERRDAQTCGVDIVRLDGQQARERDWADFWRFYASTFERKSGMPTLSLAFFLHLAETLPEQILLVMAYHHGKAVAGAFNLRGSDTLYGRHYGCDAHYRHLHFELCYYQTLDDCLQRGLARFEAGAQGEHKLSRGFLPQATWSAHRVADATFSRLIGRFLAQETPAVKDYIEDLRSHSPFRAADV